MGARGEQREQAPVHATGAVDFVSLTEVADDGEFRLRPEGDVAELAQSMGRLGQLVPVELRPWAGAAPGAGGPRWQLVCGFRRVAAAKLLARERVLARLHRDLSSGDAWGLALAEALLARPWTGEELEGLRARLAQRGGPHWAEELVDEARACAPVPVALREAFYEFLSASGRGGHVNEEEAAAPRSGAPDSPPEPAAPAQGETQAESPRAGAPPDIGASPEGQEKPASPPGAAPAAKAREPEDTAKAGEPKHAAEAMEQAEARGVVEAEQAAVTPAVPGSARNEARGPSTADEHAPPPPAHAEWPLVPEGVPEAAVERATAAPASSAFEPEPLDPANVVEITPEELVADLLTRLTELNQDLALAYDAWEELPPEGRRKLLEGARWLANLVPYMEAKG